MSTAEQTIISCDGFLNGVRCDAWEKRSEGAAGTHKALRHMGWRRLFGLDLCPDCIQQLRNLKGPKS